MTDNPPEVITKTSNTTVKKKVLSWVMNMTYGYPNLDLSECQNTRSFRCWNDGLGFLALVHAILSQTHPDDVFDFESFNKKDAEKNLKTAFKIAGDKLGIIDLLLPEDLLEEAEPDAKSMLLYLAEFHTKFREMRWKRYKK